VRNDNLMRQHVSHLVASPIAMKRRKAVILSILTLAAIAGLNQVRLQVGGLRNMLSLTYWRAHLSHTDLYAPNAMMLKHGNRAYREIALTIDDGPHPQSCSHILDVLKENGVHATFFPVGKRIKEHPDLVRRMVIEGHEVGNHTQDHLRLTTLRSDQVRTQLEFCELNFFKATGRHMSLMRPPGMNYNEAVLEIAKAMGYTTVNWTTAAKDFISGVEHKTEVPPEVVAERVLREADNGGIILVHDAPDTADALPVIIKKLKSLGYRFVTIPEMLEHLPKPVKVSSVAGPYVSAPASK
jgi:peptidoglycan/xylan/chitin deacetylase (PgdA/CDA1 family)